MTVYEITRRIDAFLENGEQAFLKSIFQDTSNWFLELARAQSEFFKNRGHTNAEAGVNEVVSRVDQKLKTWPKGRLFRQIDSLATSIKELGMMSITAAFCGIEEIDGFNDEKTSRYLALQEMGQEAQLLGFFEAEYEEFLASPNVSGIYSVLEIGHSIHLRLMSFSLLLWDIREELQSLNNSHTTDDESELSIFLEGTDRLDATISKLVSIDEIYKEYCKILGISIEDNPLRIGKIESGSLWLKLFGENRVISLITDGLREAAAFAYRNMTKEGRRRTKSAEKEDLLKMIDLVPKLEALGLDTSEIKETLGASAKKIAENQFNFLAGESRVFINNEVTLLKPPIMEVGLDYMFASNKPELTLPEPKKMLESGETDSED